METKHKEAKDPTLVCISDIDCTFVYISVYVHVFVHVCLCVHVCMCVCMCMCVYVCAYMHACECMFLHTSVHVAYLCICI